MWIAYPHSRVAHTVATAPDRREDETSEAEDGEGDGVFESMHRRSFHLLLMATRIAVFAPSASMALPT